MAGLSLRVLVDNATLTDRFLAGEPALSFYLECGGKKILFDTGYSGQFYKNAGKMGIDLLDLDYVVLSHGHIDHTGGLPFLLRSLMEAAVEKQPHRIPEIIAHPHCFFPRPVPGPGDIGTPVDAEMLSRWCTVTTSRNLVRLTGDLVFLGEIDRVTDVVPDRGKKRTLVTPSGPEPDRLLDDSALAYISDMGLVVITGCSHAGIPNLIEHARKVTGENRIRDVIGGFHLMENDRATIDATVAYLRKVRPAMLHPCHCTSLAAKIALAAVAPVSEVGVGLMLTY